MFKPAPLHFGVSAFAVCVTLTLYLLFQPPAARTASPNVVISQIYGAGGNSGASFRNDFIELFNRGSAPVNLSGWSVQYASSAGTTWQQTNLAGTLQPGQYFLIQQFSGGANGALLPAPDVTGTIPMAATAGKVALLNTTTLIASGTTCPSGATVVDLTGYGTGTNCFEGSGPTPAPSATNAVFRAANGCTDNDNNATDFAAAAANPRNTASPLASCSPATPPTGTGAANPNPVITGNVTLLTVTVTPGTNPASTNISVTGNLSNIGGAANQAFFDNGTNGDATPNDNVFSFQANVPANLAPGLKTLPINVADAQSRTSTTNISLQVNAPLVAGDVVISQVYGGGGNSGASFANDFIELFNRSNQPMNISGWSVQYASATGTTWQKTDLTGTLQPGQYFLIQEDSGGSNGVPLPMPNAAGTIALAATAGKVALVNNGTLITSGVSCPSGGGLVDFVGYGSSANCFEGSGPTPAPSATNSVFRVANGCTDNNNNATDFAAAAVNPRNTASPLASCVPSPLTGVGAANPNPVIAGNATLLTVTVTPGTNPASTNISVTGDLSNLGGAANQPFFDNGTNGDATPNDNVFSFQANVPANLAPGLKTLPINLADAQLRTSTANISLQVRAPVVAGDVVISQVYGGGGNSGAPFANDFIELFNRSSQPVDITGWSVQYTSATGATWQKTDLMGTLQPGQYFLIQEDSGGSNGAPLPAPNATGTIALAATAGKVALVNNGTLITSGVSCPSGLVDFAGYGSTANCFEGAAPAPAPSNTNAIARSGGGCADTNNNSANFAARAPMPRNLAAPFNTCGGGALFDANNVTLTIQALPTCIGAGDVLIVEANLTNVGTRNQTNNPGSEFVAKLSPTLVVVPDSCISIGVGVCTITNASQFDWNGTIPVGETVTIRFQAQVKDDVAANAPLCVNTTANYDSDNDGLNDAVRSVNECRLSNCPLVGPGQAFPTASEVSDQKAGSVLVYPFYSSDPVSFNRENARLNLTNTHPQRRVAVHLFFIEDDSGDITDAFLCLTPNQTASLLLSDLDPGVSGYLIAIACDERLGCPISFNFLIGDEYVKLAAGHAANLTAEAFAALAGAPVPCDELASTAELKFDGVQYNAAPRTLAVDNLPSPVDGNTTLLILDRFGGNLATGLSTLGELTGLLYNDQENAFSFEFSSGRRQFRAVISNVFPRTAPRVPALIPRGHSGWLKLARGSDGAILGAIINFNPGTSSSASAFNQGHNLHKLTLTTEASLIVPVFPPNC